MKKMIARVFLAAAFVMLAAAQAECVEFSFTIPTIPATPKIISVSNSSPIEGGVVTVYANIEGQIQKSVCCNGVCTFQCEPNCNFTACDMVDFYGETDIRIVPNPTCIPNTVDSSGGSSTSACQKSSITNPKLYYYYLDNPATMGSTGMTYDASTGNFKADVPISSYSANDAVTYFIIAADNRGNVISQVPSSTEVPCSSASVSAWTSTLATPAIDNCSVMNSYEQCGKYKAGKPTCATTTSANDPTGDTCGSTGAIDTSGNNNRLDVTGISAGIGTGFSELAGQKVVCSKISLTANSPDIGDNSTPIGAYVMIFFNPDIIDPNPNDVYMTNATAITYAPGISGVEPNLVKVLWDGECVTNPNTPDILGCKLVVGGSNETKLKISSGDKSLLFIAQDGLPNGKNIVGTSSKTVTAVIASGAIQLDGGTPFWLVDLTSGFAVVQKNQSFTILDPANAPAPAAPLVDSLQTCVNGAGTSTLGECTKAASQSTNKCRLSIKPSPDASTASEYRVYKATTNSATTAISNGVVTTVSSNLTSINSYDDTISTLDGKIYYYFFSAYSSSSSKETESSKMSSSKCTVEDWVAPVPPVISSCSTPAGNYGKCLCSWTADTATDPSLRKFKILRDTTSLSSDWPAANGITSYQYTDSDPSLVLGQSYTYYVSAIDAGANESSAVSTTCVPEDLQAPEKVGDFSAFNVAGLTTLDADIKWDGVTDTDAATYNVYKCFNESLETSCTTFPHANWTKANSGTITHTGEGLEHALTILDVPNTGTKDFEGNYCFWVEACDNCVTAGTCESTDANCSGFDTLPAYRVCIDITNVPDTLVPATPTNVVAEALPQGKSCKLTWTKVTTQKTGELFENQASPSNMDLDKYAIMSAPFGETLNTNPIQYTPTGTANKASSPSYTNSGLSNGTLYQYYVIAYDSNQNFSDPQASITTCTPEDTTAPDDPAGVTVVLGNGDTTCDVSWDAVTDNDVISYSVHRCDDTIANCTTVGQFPATWGENLGFPYTDISVLELSDFDVDVTSNSYTYCITAKDPSDNETDILGTGNCAMCSNEVIHEAEPPTGVSAVAYGGTGVNYGVKITYTNSPSYVVNGNTGGHNIYYCPDAACATKTKINTSLETTSHASTSYDKANLGISPAGPYYFGVLYINTDNVESSIVVTSTPVTIDVSSCNDNCVCGDPIPSTCNISIQISGKFLERKLVSCTSADAECKTGVVKYVDAPYVGSMVQVVNASTGDVVKEVSPETSGTVSEIKVDSASEVSPGVNYKVVLHVPADVYTGLYTLCENADTAAVDGCDIVVSAAQTLSANTTVTGTAKTVSKARLLDGENEADVFIGNGGDIGNANGDSSVNLVDLAAIKSSYGKTSTHSCYRAWADFNMDGAVNISDLVVLKNNYGKTVTGASPTLSKTKQPIVKGDSGECCVSTPCP